MKKQMFLLFAALSLIVLITLASAQPVLDYTIVDDKVFVEIDFGSVSDLEYKLPYDARVVESNSDFEIVNNTLKVAQSEHLTIDYITESLIEKSSKRNFFIFNNDFDEGIVMTLRLPEGGVLDDEGLLFPDPDIMLTDGRVISLRWNNLVSEEAVVSYEVIEKDNYLWVVFIGIALIGIVAYQSIALKRRIRKLKKKKKISRKRQKTKAKKAITRNLFGEEKKIVEYLLGRKKNESWTKEISRDLEISKVRLSRRLRNLQQKELIEKIPYGNENRIKLVKKA
jgi:uncharacterized membrane protein